MSGGRLIAVVGPSGVGKDSVMAGLVAARPGLGVARRVITRDAALGGEDFDALDEPGFHRAAAAGAFALHWGAHGLYYGIPARYAAAVTAGQEVLANLSRGVLEQARARFAAVTVLHLTARPDTLAARLAGRGRESAEEIAARLARAVPPAGPLVEVSNDGPLEATVAAELAALYPVKA